MNELGMVTISFLIVRIRVTKGDFSTTFPTVSLTLIKSPVLKGRMYVITKPAIKFDITELDPSETIRPTKTDIPWKTPDSEPGR